LRFAIKGKTSVLGCLSFCALRERNGLGGKKNGKNRNFSEKGIDTMAEMC
jgi:hypothetical protein